MISDETQREIDRLAGEMATRFTPPEYIPGCKVLSVADKNQYATDNGWIEALCGRHNRQRCRWMGQLPSVAVNDFVDVQHFPNIRHFTVFGQGGTSAAATGSYLLTDGTRAGSTSQAQDFGATGIKADVVAESTGAAGVLVDGNVAIDNTLHSLFYLPKYGGEYQYFNDNDSSYPAGWTETVAPGYTDTNFRFNLWRINDNNGAQWDYRLRTSTLNLNAANIRTVIIGPTFFDLATPTVAMEWRLAMHSETTSSSGLIDTTKYVAFDIGYNSGWRYRSAYNSGGGETSGSYTSFSGDPLLNGFYVFLTIYPVNGSVRCGIGNNNKIFKRVLSSPLLGSGVFVGNAWLRFSLTTTGAATSNSQIHFAGFETVNIFVA